MANDRLLVTVPDAQLRDALGPTPDGVEIVIWDMTGPAPAHEVDIVVPPYLGRGGSLSNLTDVQTRLVQSQFVGYDGIDKLLPPGHVYANASSVHETSTAELAVALILASQRGLPDFVRAAEGGHWAPTWHQSLADRTVVLIGFGPVGRAIEERLLPFETNVVRVAHWARTDERGVIHGVDELADLLPTADIVVVAVSLNDSTMNLIDEAFLGAMRDGSLLVNISRGKVADTDALLAHATTGRLRIALDVTDPEPLPEGHPLFALPSVLISPHVGGATSAMLPRMARLLNEQIARMLRGLEPLNVVLTT
jgi:phosphoglycerate dehydrogenase-like enzyme